MRIELACFSDRGYSLGKTLARKLAASGDTVGLERCGGGTPLREWTAARFRCADALVFIGATGIAVRAVAPHLTAKTSDPAVVVVDELGHFAISLLSGHIGGANALAGRIASLVDAVPVITTATDINAIFAIDSWAKKNGLAIINPEKIKAVSARLLAGGQIKLASAFPIEGTPPAGVRVSDDRPDVRIDIREPASRDALILVPPAAALGVGCRKGTPAEALGAAFDRFCQMHGIFPESFGRICSIDIKRDEPGLVMFCEKRRLPLETFDAASLMSAAGDFTSSAFVRAVTGADNVCERSAVLGAGGGLLAGRTTTDGVTMAAALGEYVVDFTNEGEAHS